MSTNRAMAFIDGENLTMRYQAMLAKNNNPIADNIVVPDVLAWNPRGLTIFPYIELLRATYYTYAVGSDEQIDEWKTKIRGISYTYRSDRGSFTYSGSMIRVARHYCYSVCPQASGRMAFTGESTAFTTPT